MRGVDRTSGWARRLAGADRWLLAVAQGRGRRIPGVVASARALSYGGEHAALWLAAGCAGALADRDRRGAWLRGTALVAATQLTSSGLKHLVRRARPAGPVRPLVSTAGRYAFPSSHAASATAAAVTFGALGGPAVRRLLRPAAAAMCLSRLVVGVHHPADVAAGALLGALTATAGRHRLRGGTATGTAVGTPGRVTTTAGGPGRASGTGTAPTTTGAPGRAATTEDGPAPGASGTDPAPGASGTDPVSVTAPASEDPAEGPAPDFAPVTGPAPDSAPAEGPAPGPARPLLPVLPIGPVAVSRGCGAAAPCGPGEDGGSTPCGCRRTRGGA
ncbi:phosphatase PAP2 family protein [Streptomyces pyxinae]|uniref:phosphatase PAP2 family protein n=1 Tax=Streptomyces pyxinae TaxID=2970734 RepID=UPI003D179470